MVTHYPTNMFNTFQPAVLYTGHYFHICFPKRFLNTIFIKLL